MIRKSTPRFFQNAGVVKLYLLLVPGALIISAAMGFDGSLMNGLQGVDRWDAYFGHPRGSLLGILNAILPLGAVFGTLPAAWVSDRYGRRAGLCVGDVIMIIATGIQTSSINIPMYMVSRFLIGFGLAIAGTAAPMMVAELAHPSSRTTLTSMYNTLWYFGAIIAAWTTYGSWRIDSEWAWRFPTLLQAVPAMINLAAVGFMPESPRWLVAKERELEALTILVRYHSNGDAGSAMVANEFDEIRETIRLEGAGSGTSWWELKSHIVISLP